MWATVFCCWVFESSMLFHREPALWGVNHFGVRTSLIKGRKVFFKPRKKKEKEVRVNYLNGNENVRVGEWKCGVKMSFKPTSMGGTWIKLLKIQLHLRIQKKKGQKIHVIVSSNVKRSGPKSRGFITEAFS